MKGFVASVGLLIFLGLAYGIHTYLKESVQDQVIIEWSNSLIWGAIGSQASVKFITPQVQAEEEPGRWSVSGEIALREGTNEANQHGYSAVIAKVCEPAESRDCWRLEKLVIGGSEVDLSDLYAGYPANGRETSPAEPGANAEMASGALPASNGGSAPENGGGLAESPQTTMAETPDDGTPESPGAAVPQEQAAQGETATAPAETAAVPAETTTAPQAEQALSASERQQMVAQIQARLRDLGYDPGPVDGLMGPQTKTAIETYQRAHEVAVDGRPSRQLLQHLEQQSQ